MPLRRRSEKPGRVFPPTLTPPASQATSTPGCCNQKALGLPEIYIRQFSFAFYSSLCIHIASFVPLELLLVGSHGLPSCTCSNNTTPPSLSAEHFAVKRAIEPPQILKTVFMILCVEHRTVFNSGGTIVFNDTLNCPVFIRRKKYYPGSLWPHQASCRHHQ